VSELKTVQMFQCLSIEGLFYSKAKLQANGWRWRSRRYYHWSSIWKTTQFLMGYCTVCEHL